MKTFNLSAVLAVFVFGLLICPSVQALSIRTDNGLSRKILLPADLGYGFRPDGKGGVVAISAEEAAKNAEKIATKAAAPSEYGINYNGGMLMLGKPNIFYIWYGDWSDSTTTTILTDFAKHLAPSAYYKTNTTYGDDNGNVISNVERYYESFSTKAYKGNSLSDKDILNIVSETLAKKKLPKKRNAVYFVLTSKEVTARSGFCTRYCGWHHQATIGNTSIKYAFVGDPTTQCLGGCASSQNLTSSPNDNPGADAMANVIAHELVETITDPDFYGWWVNDPKNPKYGKENGDLCAWRFGATYTTANGSVANMKLGDRNFLIQQNWVNDAPSGHCALSL